MRPDDRYAPHVGDPLPKPAGGDPTAGLKRYQVPNTEAYIWAASDDEAQDKFAAYIEATTTEGPETRRERLSRERGARRGAQTIKWRSPL